MTRLEAVYIEEALRFVRTREELLKEIGEYGMGVLDYAHPAFAQEYGIYVKKENK